MKIELVSYNETFTGHISECERLCFSNPWSEDGVRQFFENSNNGAVIALVSGEFAGYVTYSHVLDEIQIANVAVMPEFRRKSVAESIVAELVKIAKQLNAVRITLEVRESNVPAIKLYEKTGFEKIATRKGFYTNPREDAFIMDKLL